MVFVFAQLSTSVSDDQIRLIIVALLVVAVLLAILTIWYFVKTSPSRRVRAAQARRQSAAARPGTNSGPQSAAAPSSVRHEAPPVADPVADTFADDAAEWDRLTAPEPRRPAGS